MVNEIRQYLDSSHRDYQAGVALYSQYGPSETLKRMFSWGKTSYNQEKLIEALEGLVNERVSECVNNTFQSPSRSITQSLEELDNHWKPLYKQASYKHSQLHHVAPEERKKLAFEILDSFEKIDPLLEKKDAIVKSGKLPEETAQPATSKVELTNPVDILKKITNLTVQISKHRRNEKRAEEVKNWEKERDELKRRLNG